MELGKKIRRLRKESGYSIKGLCAVFSSIGKPLCEKTIYKWENNEVNPDIDNLHILANIFNVSVSSFFETHRRIQSLNQIESDFISAFRHQNDFQKIILILSKNFKGESYV